LRKSSRYGIAQVKRIGRRFIMTTDEGRAKYIERRLLEARSKEDLDKLFPVTISSPRQVQKRNGKLGYTTSKWWLAVHSVESRGYIVKQS
jgi:hypothetical protein